MTPRLLRTAEIAAMQALRREALTTEPASFKATPDDDPTSDPAFVARALLNPLQAFFVAPDGDALVGMVGLVHQGRAKVSHRAHVWGMYVRPAWRGAGVGAALLTAAIAHARSAFVGVTRLDLSVTSAAPAARRLYERAGFTCWGTEPGAMRVDGVALDEHHYVLWL